MSGHVFISYDHEHDAAYVDGLASRLTAAGLPVWCRRGAMTESQWSGVVAPQLDTCGAVVVVMTPEAQRSEWVTREVDVALRDGRPIASLLLRGDPFFLLAGLPHEDVSTGGPPGSGWVEGLRAMMAPRAIAVAVQLDGGRTAEALGIEVKGGVFVPLLERGAAVPCQRTEIFTTADDGQSQIKVTVYRGNSGMAAQNQRVGVFEVRVPNPGARGTANIAVTFDIDPRGGFRLLAVDQGTGLPAPVTTVG